MKPIIITYKHWLSDSKLHIVKEIKNFSNWGLKESKDLVDEIDEYIRLGKSVSVGADSEVIRIISFLKLQKLLYFTQTDKVKDVIGHQPLPEKKENHRVIAKRTKEYEQAEAWVKSLHPKKQAMIKLLIDAK